MFPASKLFRPVHAIGFGMIAGEPPIKSQTSLNQSAKPLILNRNYLSCGPWEQALRVTPISCVSVSPFWRLRLLSASSYITPGGPVAFSFFLGAPWGHRGPQGSCATLPRP